MKSTTRRVVIVAVLYFGLLVLRIMARNHSSLYWSCALAAFGVVCYAAYTLARMWTRDRLTR
jgi:hypothetical protein